MTSRKQGQQVQWSQTATQKSEQAKQRAQAPWDTKGRSQKPSKHPFARVFTGCSY